MTEEWVYIPPAETVPEFRYDGIPAGYFEDGIVPVEPGAYRYMACRSFGHYAMGQMLLAGDRPVCTYESPAGTVRFEVTGRDRDGRLHLDNFTFPAA